MATSATKRPIPLLLEDRQIALLDRESERKGISRSELIRQLIEKGWRLLRSTGRQ